MSTPEIVAFACSPRCGAGGSDQDNGHVFDIDRDFIRCDECGGEYTIAAGTFYDTRQLRKVPCKLCGYAGALGSNGGSLFCKCGASAMDVCLMRGD